MEISDDKFTEYAVDHAKMKVLRKVAKKDSDPNRMLDWILKTVDETWDEEMKNLKPPKKKVTFVTKF